jgi:D-galactarolactone cycloisomerase
VQADAGGVGIAACKQIGLAAAEVGGHYVPHCYGTGVLQAATLHMLAALPFESWLEFPFEASPLSRDVLTERFEPIGGYVSVLDRPGLGVELAETVVARFLVGRSTATSIAGA